MKETTKTVVAGDIIANGNKLSMVVGILLDNSVTTGDGLTTIIVEDLRDKNRYEILKRDLHKYEIFRKEMLDSIKKGITTLTKSDGGFNNELLMADGSILQVNELNTVRLVDTLKINDLVYFGMSIYRISEIVTIGNSRHGLTMDDLMCNNHKIFLNNSDIDRMTKTLTDEKYILRHHDFLGTYNYNELNTFIHRVFKEIRNSYLNTPDYINNVYSGTNADRLMDNLYTPSKIAIPENEIEYNENYLLNSLWENIDINDDVNNLNLHDIVLYNNEITIVSDIEKSHNDTAVTSFTLMSIKESKSNIKKVYTFDNTAPKSTSSNYDEELSKLKHLGSYINFIDGVKKVENGYSDTISLTANVQGSDIEITALEKKRYIDAMVGFMSKIDTEVNKILQDWYIRNDYPLDWFKDNNTSHDLIDFIKMYDSIDNHTIMVMCSPYYRQNKIEFVNLSGINKKRVYDLKADDIVDIKGELYFFKSYKNNGKLGCDVHYENCLTGTICVESYMNDSKGVKFMGVMTITEIQRRDKNYLNLGDLLGDGVYKKRNEFKYGDIILFGTIMYFVRRFDKNNNNLHIVRCIDGEESILLLSGSSEIEYLGDIPEVNRKIDKVTETILQNKDMCSEYGKKLHKPFRNFRNVTIDILREDSIKYINERINYDAFTTTDLYNFVTNKGKL